MLSPGEGTRMATAGRVLLIDDDEGIRELVSVALSEEGYEIFTAPSGDVGLDMAVAERPDVILLDTRMPGMDGWEFARRYRESGHTHAPLIILTAIDQPEQTAIDIGADGYLAKPFDLDDLSAIVRQHISPAH
jgi:DNA-binding response OmpR family regulator